MFKLAYNAGHILATAGKRLPKELDKNETREWTLNDRVARYFAAEMAQYDGVELRRMDDPKGIEPIDIDVRVERANEWKADFYLSIHHNAAGVIFSGGGAEVYIDADGGKSEQYARAIYNAIIAATGLKGNRSDPLRSASDGVRLYEVRATTMPAVLVECGYMDSTVDAPIILTDDFAKKTGVAIAQGIAKVAGLKAKTTEAPPEAVETPDSGVLYCVQVGAYSQKKNAENQLAKVKSAGFSDAFITTKGGTVDSGTVAVAEPKPKVDIDAIARDVIKGKYGNGTARKDALVAKFGADIAAEVQKRVNELLN